MKAPKPDSDEWLDVVDAHDIVQKQVLRREVEAYGFHSFRAIHAFLRNDRGDVWIPTRTLTKKLFPGCLDFSVSGHVMAGEDYDSAFIREMKEEIGVDASSVPWRRIARVTPPEHGVFAFEWVYEVATNVTPDHNPDDFSHAEWLNPRVLLEKLSQGAPQKSDLLIVTRLCYGEGGG